MPSNPVVHVIDDDDAAREFAVLFAACRTD